MPLNDLGQPVGEPLGAWRRPPRPGNKPLEGRYVHLEPLALEHAEALYAAFLEDSEHRCWTYLPYGPFQSLDEYRTWLGSVAGKPDPFFYAVIDNERGTAAGVASFLRIDPAAGSIEVGHINFAPPLQRSRAATEAMYLMAAYTFDELRYRRYEWKCDALNAPSMRAAKRLGFIYEGIFRQATHYKGRNRDTAWYAIIDRDWPQLQAGYEGWLAPENFDEHGRQRRTLAECISG